MNVLDEIVNWAQNIPGWQADAVRRLLAHGELDESDECELFAMLRAKYNLLPGDQKAPHYQKPSRASVSDAKTKSREIKILALRNLANVNAIAAEQTLNFGRSGITVVYGRNASGKTGYVRVLKRACRARDSKERIHGNVFDARSGGFPSAVFDLSIDGVQQSVNWQEDSPPPKELTDIAVFDARCARMYVDERNEVTYIPYGMDVFQKLVDLCNRFRETLVADRDSINLHPQFLDEFDGDTDTGRMVSEINANTVITWIEEKARVSEAEKKRIASIGEFLKRAEVETPKARASALRRFVGRIAKLRQDIECTVQLLSATNLSEVRATQQTFQDTSKAAKIASQEAFKDLPLRGVGTDPWRALFEAAKEYSTIQAYPEQEFPVLAPGSRCVLCQQLLDADAQNRFERFKGFVLDQTARNAEKARVAFESKREELQKIKPDLIVEHEEVLAEVEARSDQLAQETRVCLEEIAHVHKAASEAIETNDWTQITGVAIADLTKLDSLVRDLQAEAADCDSMAEPDELKERRREHRELAQRLLLSKHLREVLALVENLKRCTRLESCIGSLNTRAITLKNSELMEAVTTEALRSGLEREIEEFRVQRLQVSLDKSGGKGITFHQLSIPRRPGEKALLSEILSEGEQRVLGIASFLAELNTTPTCNTIVFDDPVCSLDHEFREKVAKRVVQEGSRRQVVVFTHDIVFLLALERYATEQQVPLKVQEIRREGLMIGSCRDDIPWSTQNTKQRIGFLRKFLQEDVKHSVGDDDKYAANVVLFYGRLREAWERAIEE